MSCLDNKYKDRQPSETVDIIKDFFEKRGFLINEEYMTVSEIGTYSGFYTLTYNNNIVLYSCGKGTNEIYCRASGYSEMYERFCAFPVLCFNPLNYHFYTKYTLEKNKYNTYPDEKKIINKRNDG